MNCGAEFPWSAVVGIAGIVGTLLGVRFANSAAERRQQLTQQHEDRTRFHKERIEIYARFLRASQTCREAAFQFAPVFLENTAESQGRRVISARAAAIERLKNAVRGLGEAREIVGLVASDEVNLAADEVTGSAGAIVVPELTAQQLDEINGRLAADETAFRAAVRKELLSPPDSA